MTDFNPITFIMELWNGIIGFATSAYEFLFTELTVAEQTFTAWQLICGVGLVAILVLVVVKAITPLL